MKYINTYSNTNAYNNAISSMSFPNVSFIEASDEVKYARSKAATCDIYGSYSAGTTPSTISLNGTNLTVRDMGNNQWGWNTATAGIGTLTDMSYMFNYSSDWLVSVDAFKVNTSSVTNMKYMFYNCKKLASINLAGLDTSSVTNMESMFYGCSLATIDLSGLDVSKVTNMKNLASSCTNLVTIYLDGWSMNSGVNAQNMLSYNSKLRHIHMNGTPLFTFDTVKGTLSGSVRNAVTIHRDGLAWTWNGSQWASTEE